VRVPRGVHADLRAASPPREFDDVVKAVGYASEAMGAGDVARAVELLTWAKAVAGRSAAVREAFGLALYHAGRFEDAHRELLAYRRLSGRVDQNHVLADCARALGRHDRVAEYVEAMEADPRIPTERQIEGLIVLAGDRADRGDLRGAMAILERGDLDPVEPQRWHPRLWYAAGDLSERMGELDRARDLFEAADALDDGDLDAAERRAALD
jgi:tetratricopeptide (TPR) repeat protein